MKDLYQMIHFNETFNDVTKFNDTFNKEIHYLFVISMFPF